MNMLRNDADSLHAVSYDARLAIRAGTISGTTSGLAPGFTQGNIVILPAAEAALFIDFCKANQRACPLLATSLPGDPSLPTLGRDIDMRTDLPGYYVVRNGVVGAEQTDIKAEWRDDLVTCVIGCSFTFEAALIEAGILLRHIAQGRNVAMYRTNRPNVAVGPFQGPMVVSMRPLRPADADRAAEITAQFPQMHGAPIHRGDAAVLGIADLMRPDYGDAVEIAADEIPVFWACGVTSQLAVELAKLPFFIAHVPGKMLITDHRQSETS